MNINSKFQSILFLCFFYMDLLSISVVKTIAENYRSKS